MKKFIAPLVLVLLLGTLSVYSFQHGWSPKPAPKAVTSSGTGETLSQAKPSETVFLNDGDTYQLTTSFVQKRIGNDTAKMLAYNGSVPGPVIRVKEGSKVTVNLVNRMDIATTLHPHGIRLANAFDGVPDVTQKAVQPGESFAYELRFPDPGVYWYHPHFRQDYTQDFGLYGAFVVEPKDAAYWSDVNREEVLMVDDVLMENGGIVPYSATKVDHALMGRFGNAMLVNGETDYALDVRRGETIRFYIANAANTRTFNLAIPNAKMKLVGADNGKYEKEAFVDSILLAPSERAIVEVLFDQPGTTRIEHRTPGKTYTMGSVSVTDLPVERSFSKNFALLRTNADTVASIDPLRSTFARDPDKRITLSMAMRGMGNMMGMGEDAMQHGMGMGTMGTGNNIEWEDEMPMMNGVSTSDTIAWKIVDQETDKENMDIDWKFKQGDQVKIRIFNDPKSPHPMQHPIHFHGQRFLVLSTNGVKNANLAWKDTALVQTGDTVDLLVDMENPGTWVAHCHISEHPEAGMMMAFTVS